MDKTTIIEKITAFLNGIGIPVREGTLPDDTFLPGIRLEHGGLVYDPARMTYPGDLLHEAGHIAVMKPSQRQTCFADAGPEMGEEIAAQAWSYAAAIACGIEPEVVFHDHGYKGGGTHAASLYREGHWPGVPLLAWMGLTGMPEVEGPMAHPKFPEMKAWMRTAEDPSAANLAAS
ncbi:hypothetical protein [Kordiimonas lacus]|uniref:Uncharacterized protein n=1 Tax=Kordiimonas lacus TaxID=637679 RepID=A0A1G7A1F1_9PROT|nr:hypothetical protein [Kordiimonas lacus]SDE08758.1 hypothetical protein SAMN04488071_2051 [Kordiimonas lacus]